MPDVLDEIRAERGRQIAKGYDAPHDDKHVQGSLAYAGAMYAAPEPKPVVWAQSLQSMPRRKRLIAAAALLVAEVERIDRMEGLSNKGGG